MAALLTSETGNTEKVVKYINEARGMGITVLPPDVNSSDLDFTPVGEAIRFGLRAIKNVGENTVQGHSRSARGSSDASARSINSAITSIRACLNKRVLESLIKSGAMDSLGRAPRADVCGDRPRHGARAAAASARTSAGSTACLEEPRPRRNLPKNRLPDLEEWPEHEIAGGGIRDGGLLHFRPSALETRGASLHELGARGTGRHGGPPQRRGNHRRGDRDRHAQHALAQRRSLGNSHAAGHDRRARSAGVSGSVRAPRNAVQERTRRCC